MKAKEIIGKKITNIYSLLNMEVGGLDTCECFIELDNSLIIEFPFGLEEIHAVRMLPNEAVSYFANLEDYPICHINKNNKSVSDIANNYQHGWKHFCNRICKFLFGGMTSSKDYQPYKMEFKENKLKYLKDRIITDVLWYPDDNEKVLFLLDNNYLITETMVAPHGTGLAGLNYFENIEQLEARRGSRYMNLSNEINRISKRI